MVETAEAEFPGLFCHPNRADWGVGVLSGERDGKRTYLFEGGQERVMGKGPLDMMSRIAPLTAEQRSTLARLTALVARRHGTPDSSRPAGLTLIDQVATLRGAFPQGLGDPAWQSQQRAARAREQLVPKAQALLSHASLDAQRKPQQLDELWAGLKEILGATGWVPADQLKAVPANGLGTVAAAVRELLYGAGTIEQRVDAFSAAFETTFRRPARWELTTGILALVSPGNHVLVELASFRKLFKLIGAKGTLSQAPNGAGYTRCLNAARLVASKLTEQGEVPRDLLDVHDFLRFALQPAPRQPKASKAPKKKSRDVEAEAEAEDTADAD